MKITNETIKVKSTGMRPTFHTLTEKVKEIVEVSQVKNGMCLIYSRHTTCSVMIDEDSFDKAYTGMTFLQQDLTDVFEKIIPTCRKEGQYMHPGPELTVFAAEHGEDKPGTLNTDAHLRSSIVGRSETIPIIEGNLELGEFGHIYFVDFDHTRARERKVYVQIIGE
ncbi:YjbQ family protein [Oceanispirochaeta crateris]|uniref:YjbQ family protein n=1 Tax=Oceanispirochaeta crateris TaxID=2518645 RepID=A0A5C1QT18_9SPIO|nr:secondary thiamine-phosphate synthase enzyme YjbQ [Oceanispirochaeta crateris]QEN09162.1 YjbQ family protein [Oceanispirochaeta crateris]